MRLRADPTRIEQLRRTIELDPNFFPPYDNLGDAYWQKGMHGEAVAQYLKAREVRGDSPREIAALRAAYASSGWKGYMQKEIDLAIERSQRQYIRPWDIASSYVALSDKDKAFAWLEKAYEERSPAMTRLKTPWCDGLRSDPRFQDLVRRRVGLPQ